MQYTRAKELRDAWGNKPCNHPQTDKEYMLGADTGDEVCTTCGAYVPPESARPSSKPKRTA